MFCLKPSWSLLGPVDGEGSFLILRQKIRRTIKSLSHCTVPQKYDAFCLKSPRFCRMFVFQKSTGPQIKAILVVSLSETMKTKSDQHLF